MISSVQENDMDIICGKESDAKRPAGPAPILQRGFCNASSLIDILLKKTGFAVCVIKPIACTL
jgi:hypothetical protein